MNSGKTLLLALRGFAAKRQASFPVRKLPGIYGVGGIHAAKFMRYFHEITPDRRTANHPSNKGAGEEVVTGDRCQKWLTVADSKLLSKITSLAGEISL